MNLEDVRGKLDVLAANRRQLDWLRMLPEAEFSADVRNLDSALHRLQTSIQALLDVASYEVACLNLPSPQHSADLIVALRGAGLFDVAAADRYSRMVAFRNRVVHLYNRINPAFVHEILQKNLEDLDQLRQVLMNAILQHPDAGNPPGTSPA